MSHLPTKIAALALAGWITSQAVAQSAAEIASEATTGVRQREAWDASNTRHQQALHSFLHDSDAFAKLSDGKISRMSPDAADMLGVKLKRQGIEIDPAAARLLSQHLTLVVSGRHPRTLKPARLVRPYAPGNSGLHGFVAESELIGSDDSLRFSRKNSLSSDFTRRSADGVVRAHGQSKCNSTLNKSRNGIIDSFVKFNRTPYHASSALPFEGIIPKDQFDEMRTLGEIDEQGRVVDRESLRSRIRDRVEWARTSPSIGPKNREAMIEGGSRLLGASDSDLDRLRFRAHPLEYDQVVQRTNELQRMSYAQDSPLSVSRASDVAPSNPIRIGRSGGVVAMMIALAGAEVGSLGSRGVSSPSAIDALAASSAALEPAAELKGSHKRGLEKILKHLPKQIRPKIPPVERIRTVGRWAGRLGTGVVLVLITYDTVKFARGTIDARSYSAAMSGAGGALAGAAAGAWNGRWLGPLGALTGAVLGGVIGALSGEALSNSIFDQMDAADQRLYLDIYREQLKQAAVVPAR